MGGPNPYRSMQSTRPNASQRFNITPPGFAGNPPPYNVFLLPQPKRSAVWSAGEGCILTPTIVQPSMNHASRVEDGVAFHVCVAAFNAEYNAVLLFIIVY